MTTSTLTLTDFLLARIAEDEAAARQDLAYRGSGTTYPLGLTMDPARVLAECEAKRRIVAMGGSTCSDYGDPLNAEIADRIGMPEWLHYPDPDWTGHCDGCSAAQAADADHRRILQILAAVYVDHPDFDESWRP